MVAWAPQSLLGLSEPGVGRESLASTEAGPPPGGTFQDQKPHFWVLKSS